MIKSSQARRLAAGLFLASLPLFSSCGAESSAAGETLYFSAIPDKNDTELIQKYGIVANYLAEKLGVPVEYKPSADYPASVAAFKNGDVLLAWFGGVTGVQAREAVDGARAIAQGKVDPNFKSYFVVNASTGIQASDDFPMDLKGKKFTFGSADSTSGRIMPSFHIAENTNMSPEEFFGHPDAFSGGHDLTAKLVEAGTFDGGALNYKTYDSMVAEGKLDPAKCVKVWTTPTYPDYNFTAHPLLEERFGAGFTKKLQDALVGITDATVLAALQREEGLIAAENADFEPIAATMKAIGFSR